MNLLGFGCPVTLHFLQTINGLGGEEQKIELVADLGAWFIGVRFVQRKVNQYTFLYDINDFDCLSELTVSQCKDKGDNRGSKMSTSIIDKLGQCVW